MAEVIIKKRYTDLSFYTAEIAKGFRPKLSQLMNKYGSLVIQAARLANIPLPVFQSLLMVENTESDPNYISGAKAIGLGQITIGTALDTIIRERDKKRLSNDEITVLRKQLGARLDLILKDAAPDITGIQKLQMGGKYKPYKGAPANEEVTLNVIKTQDLLNPEFNLMVSAILISQLIDEEIEATPTGDLVRLDRVIVRYNVSYYKSVPRVATNDIITQVPKETGNYIKKMAGANGMMETLS